MVTSSNFLKAFELEKMTQIKSVKMQMDVQIVRGSEHTELIIMGI